MKNPLHYQISEYDCGPTSLLNALIYLFEREEILPEIIRYIMLYSLDCYDRCGILGKSGTSKMAMMFLSEWLNGVGRAGVLSIESRHLTGKQVYIGENSLLTDALKRGGAVVARLNLEGEHYVLFTGAEKEHILLFDPYYWPQGASDGNIISVTDKPFAYNRKVPFAYFNREDEEPYSLGAIEKREAVLLFNSRTKLTAERTIEYFI